CMARKWGARALSANLTIRCRRAFAHAQPSQCGAVPSAIRPRAPAPAFARPSESGIIRPANLERTARVRLSRIGGARPRRAAGRAAVVIASGANRVDPARAEAALGAKLSRADGDWVRATTGFAIGGVAPVGHLSPPLLLLDEDLLALDPIWAAAGSPRHVFRTTAQDLRRITGAAVAAVRSAG